MGKIAREKNACECLFPQNIPRWNDLKEMLNHCLSISKCDQPYQSIHNGGGGEKGLWLAMHRGSNCPYLLGVDPPALVLFSGGEFSPRSLRDAFLNTVILNVHVFA